MYKYKKKHESHVRKHECDPKKSPISTPSPLKKNPEENIVILYAINYLNPYFRAWIILPTILSLCFSFFHSRNNPGTVAHETFIRDALPFISRIPRQWRYTRCLLESNNVSPKMQSSSDSALQLKITRTPVTETHTCPHIFPVWA